MSITLAYIYGNRSGKKVTFTGSPQTDGYVYFNDENFYRCPVPNGDAYNTDYNLSNVQIWYTVRNCWIRANFFDNLKLRYYPLSTMYQDIENLKTRMTAVEGRCTDIETILGTKLSTNDLASVISPYHALSTYLQHEHNQLTTNTTNISTLFSRTDSLLNWLNQLGEESIGDGYYVMPYKGNGEYLLDTINAVNSAISAINSYHSTQITPVSGNIYTNWVDKSF